MLPFPIIISKFQEFLEALHLSVSRTAESCTTVQCSLWTGHCGPQSQAAEGSKSSNFFQQCCLLCVSWGRRFFVPSYFCHIYTDICPLNVNPEIRRPNSLALQEDIIIIPYQSNFLPITRQLMAVKSMLCKYARAESTCTTQWHLLLLLIAYGNGLQQLLAFFEKDRLVYNSSYSKIFGSTELE